MLLLWQNVILKNIPIYMLYKLGPYAYSKIYLEYDKNTREITNYLNR